MLGVNHEGAFYAKRVETSSGAETWMKISRHIRNAVASLRVIRD